MNDRAIAAPQLRTTPYGLFGKAPMSRLHPVFAGGLLLMGVAACAFPLGNTLAQGLSLFSLVVIPFCLVGVAMVVGAVWLLFGSRAVVVRRGRLKAWYGFGPLGFGIGLPMERLKRLRLEVSKASDTSGGVHDLPYDLIAELSPKENGAGMDRVTLVEADDPVWIHAWGEEIAEAVRADLSVARAVTDAMRPADDGIERPVPGVAYEEPPTDSPFTLDARDGHVTLTGRLDSAGRQRTTSYIVMGLFFMGISAGAAWFFYDPAMGAMMLAGLGSMLLLFFYIGLVLCAFGLLSRSNRWILDITENALLITAKQVGRTVTRTIDAGNVRTVRVAHSGETSGGNRKRGVEGTPVMQLQIVPRSGPWVRLMTGCSDESLAWTAIVLRASLGLDDDGGEEAALG